MAELAVRETSHNEGVPSEQEPSGFALDRLEASQDEIKSEIDLPAEVNAIVRYARLGFTSAEELLKEPAMAAVLLPLSLKGSVDLPPACDTGVVKVLARETVEMCGQLSQLLVVQLAAPRVAPCEQLVELRNHFLPVLPAEGVNFWPLHSPGVSAAIFTTEERPPKKAASDVKAKLKRWLLGPFYWLHILVPAGGGDLVKVLLEHYGPSVAMNFAWSLFNLQNLWILAPLAITCAVCNHKFFKPDGTQTERILWEAAKLCYVLWGAVVWFRRGWFLKPIEPEGEMHRLSSKGAASMTMSFVDIGCWGYFWRWAVLFVAVVPILAMYILLVNGVLLCVAQILVWLTYVWGDCVKLGCRDPQTKHKFLGWLAEVSVDVVLAIIFEIFFAIAPLLAKCFVSLRNYQFRDQKRISMGMLLLVIACIERIGTFGMFAFLFVPQWVEPTGDVVNLEVNCNDLLLGDCSFFCLQRKLPVAARRAVFERSLRGPFCVAPFICLLMKAIVPRVAELLDRGVRRLQRRMKLGCCAISFIVRLLTLFFSYDGDTVGGCTYVRSGWQWKRQTQLEAEGKLEAKGEELESASDKLQPAAAAAGPNYARPADLIQEAILQGARKPWEPECVLLDLETKFVWVLFFGPLYPFGLLLTLGAAFLSVKFDLGRLLIVRRRCLPERDTLVRAQQRAFLRGAVIAALGWSIGLSLLTYNNDLWKWHNWKTVISIGLASWLGAAASIILVHADVGYSWVAVAVTAVLIMAGIVLTFYGKQILGVHVS